MLGKLLRVLPAAFAASLLFARAAGAEPVRGLLVRPRPLGFLAGAPAETTWIEDAGGGVRFRSTGSGPRTVAVPPAQARVSGRYIVRLAEPALPAGGGARAATRHALDESFVRTLTLEEPRRFGASGTAGIRVVDTYDRLLAGVAVEAPPGWLARLRAMPGVAAVEEDRVVQATLDQSVHQVRGDLVRTNLQGTGRGVRVGIVDTGIDYHHAAFGGAYGPGTRVAGGADLVNGDDDPLDDQGHGTHVAGIVAGNGGDVVGMAVEATLYAYKVLDANGSGFVSTVIAGLERCADPDQDPATDDHLDVVNLSLGGAGGDPDDALCHAVDALDSLGVVVVAAAGNSGTAFTIIEPAIARGAVAVGAATRADTTTFFSSRGPGPDLAPKPDLLAPGDNIVSAARGGGRIALSGTSMAAPHVAGAAALLIQLHRDWTHEELRVALAEGARDVGQELPEQGAGLLDAYASATATLFAIPSHLGFGRVHPGGPDTTLTQVLRLRSHAATDGPVTCVVHTEHFVPGVDVNVVPATVVVPAGGEASVQVRVTLHATRPANVEPPFATEGVIEVRRGGESHRVAFSVHDCLELHVTNAGNDVVGVVHDAQRVWPSKGPFVSTWLLPVGDYGAMAFSGGELLVPFLLVPDVHLRDDLPLDMGRGFPDQTLEWRIVDESGQPHQPPRMDVVFKHSSGASLGWINANSVATTRLPAAGPDYKFEWAFYDDSGPVRYDIPGTVTGPFADEPVSNDPTALRRSTERYAVAPGDSLLPLEFRLHPDGAGGFFGFTSIDANAAPLLAPYEVTHWRAATPYPGHYRFGRWDLQLRRRALVERTGELYAGVAPMISLDHGDTVGIHPHWITDPSVLDLTGRRLDFGFGASFFNANLQFGPSGTGFQISTGQSSRLFADALGDKRAGAAARFELVSETGVTIQQGAVPGDSSLVGVPSFPIPLQQSPAAGWMLRVLAPEARVMDTPSHTTVSATIGPQGGQVTTPFLESFAVMAGGSAVEEVRFGRVRDPHVDFTAHSAVVGEDVEAALYFRTSPNEAWTPLDVHRDGARYRAPLVPVDGPVSLRLRLSSPTGGAFEMTVEPAFLAEPSPAAGAPVLTVSARSDGASVDWRLAPDDGPLVVERTETGADWLEWGEVSAGADGVAHYEDTAVQPGKRYGYRLAGDAAVAWVQVPIGAPSLSLAIAPNPAHDDVVIALGVDRPSPIKLTLLDVQGRAIRTRRLDGLAPGVHWVSVTPPSGTRPGLYFVRLERGADVITRRLTFVR